MVPKCPSEDDSRAEHRTPHASRFFVDTRRYRTRATVSRRPPDLQASTRAAPPAPRVPDPRPARAQMKGRKVSIPWHMVTEVRLPPAKREKSR